METNFVCHFMLDTSASMRYGEGPQQKLRYAAQMIAALGYAVVRQSDKVSLATFDEQIRGFVPPSNSMAQIVRMTELLDADRAGPQDRAWPSASTELTGRMKRREIVMIFSDFFTDLDPLEAALQRMRYHRHEVVLFQVMHHDELAFEFDEHDEVRRPGDPRGAARPARAHPPRRTCGRWSGSTSGWRRSASGTASSACWSTPAATWARCWSTTSTSAAA